MSGSCCLSLSSLFGFMGKKNIPPVDPPVDPPELPPEIQEAIDLAESLGGNTHGDTLFMLTNKYNDLDELDLWVVHPVQMGFDYKVGTYSEVCEPLKMSFDVNAFVNPDLSGDNIESISGTSSIDAPDGVYGIYVDNFMNQSGSGTEFNFITLYKDEGETEFKRALWLRGNMPQEIPRSYGDKTQMLHLCDLVKVGRTFKLQSIEADLEIIYQIDYEEV